MHCITIVEQQRQRDDMQSKLYRRECVRVNFGRFFRCECEYLCVCVCVCVTKGNKTLNAHKNCIASNHIRLNFCGIVEDGRNRVSVVPTDSNEPDVAMQQPYQFIDVASNFL